MNKSIAENSIVNNECMKLEEEKELVSFEYEDNFNNEIGMLIYDEYYKDDRYTRQINAIEKVSNYGIYSLDTNERNCYRYYLTINSYSKKKNDDLLKPIHINIAELVLLDFTEIFVLHQEIYIYNDSYGYYQKDIEGKIIKEHIRKHLEREFIEDKTITSIYNLILNTLSIKITDNKLNNRPKKWINFKNGYYSPLENKFYSHNPKYYEISVIPHECSPSKYPSTCKYTTINKGTLLEEVKEEPLLFKEFLNESIPNKDNQSMLGQYIGYCLTHDTSSQQFLIMCGQGGTGKSLLIRLIEEIIGKINISNVSLQGLQERFTASELYLKQVNICADIPLTALNEIDVIKKLTGEDTIYADRKFKGVLQFKSYARLIFSANGIPTNLSDKSNAFYRRMLILPMNIKPKEIDTDLLDKLKEEIPNIISWALEEYSCAEGNIIESLESKKLVKDAQKSSDTVEAFIDDRCMIDNSFRINRRTLYDSYKLYCDSEGRKYLTPNSFYKELEFKGYKQARGTTRDFVGLKINKEILLPNNYYKAN